MVKNSGELSPLRSEIQLASKRGIFQHVYFSAWYFFIRSQHGRTVQTTEQCSQVAATRFLKHLSVAEQWESCSKFNSKQYSNSIFGQNIDSLAVARENILP